MHAQRHHVVQSLDILLYELAVCSYLMDPSILRLAFRAITQFQLCRPREIDPTKSLRFFFLGICFINLGPIGRHFISPGSYETEGLLLDFVGRATPPGRIHNVLLDLCILVLQIVTLVIAYENAQYDPEFPDPLAYGSRQSRAASPTNDMDPKYESLEDPVLHLRLRPTIQHIIHPPSQREPSMPLPNTSSTTRNLGTLGRMWTARARRLDAALTRQAGGEGRIPGAMPPAG